MGSIVPIAFQALSAFQAVSAAASVITKAGARDDNYALALRQLQAQQQQQQAIASKTAALDRQEIAAKTGEAERKRRDALKRAVARQRASFGASGVSNNGGSSEAVLLGLFEESEDQKAERERLDNLKLNTIDQNLKNQKRVNTLQRTQLAERQKVTNTSSTLDSVNDLFNIF